METANGSPYRISVERMQEYRRQNLGNYLLRLDLTEENRRNLASISAAGCVDALVAGETSAALAFARFWAHYAGFEATAEERAETLEAGFSYKE